MSEVDRAVATTACPVKATEHSSPPGRGGRTVTRPSAGGEAAVGSIEEHAQQRVRLGHDGPPYEGLFAVAATPAG